MHLAADFDVGHASAVDHDIGDVVAGEQRFKRAVAEYVVADVFEQFLLLGNRHHHVLDLDDLADDIANFFAGRSSVELGQLRQVDGVDQRIENGRFDVVVFFGMAALGLGSFRPSGLLRHRRWLCGRLFHRRRCALWRRPAASCGWRCQFWCRGLT